MYEYYINFDAEPRFLENEGVADLLETGPVPNELCAWRHNMPLPPAS